LCRFLAKDPLDVDSTRPERNWKPLHANSPAGADHGEDHPEQRRRAIRLERPPSLDDELFARRRSNYSIVDAHGTEFA
jgi:hypothetical protein